MMSYPMVLGLVPTEKVYDTSLLLTSVTVLSYNQVSNKLPICIWW